MSRPLRVIIVGGGVVGLTLALCLDRANIDYILLEKRPEIAPQLGASIGLYPQTLRVFDQLGIWSAIEKLATPLYAGYHRSSHGKCRSHTTVHHKLHERFGYPVVFIQRQELLEILYERIRDKTKIKVGIAIKDIKEHGSGVTVTTGEGHTFDGDMVVGADGAYSAVRQYMWDSMQSECPREVQEDKDAMTADYQCLFGSSRATETTFVEPGQTHVAYNSGSSLTVSSGEVGKVFWFLFRKLDKTCRYPDIPRYTALDAEKLAAQYQSAPAMDNILFGDIWKNRAWYGLFALEEYVCQRWHRGRIVLCGDSVHKMTINAGFGGNCGIEGVVLLTNLLVAACGTGNGPFRLEELDRLFDEYQTTRMPRALQALNFSSHLTRVEAGHSRLYRFAGRYVMPYLPDKLLLKVFTGIARAARPLSFIHKKTLQGRMAWPTSTE